MSEKDGYAAVSPAPAPGKLEQVDDSDQRQQNCSISSSGPSSKSDFNSALLMKKGELDNGSSLQMYNGASNMSPVANEWSMVNNPEFSVHNFQVPGTTLDAQALEAVARPDEKNHIDVSKLELLAFHEKQSLTDIPHSRDSLSGRNWYVPSRESINEAVANHQPSSLPSDINHTSNSIPSSFSNTFNGHCDEHSTSKAESQSDETDINVKTSLMSFWNNMKNGFTVQMKTTFKYDCPLWLLGNVYYCKKEEREQQKIAHESGKQHVTPMDKFKMDFASKIWFTYRKDFSPLPFSPLTTDMGWGCMLRTGQMMLAQALTLHLLGRDWRYQLQSKTQCYYHGKILQFFNDKNSPEGPFSIHRLVEIGKKFDKSPGDWYGPSSVAHVLRTAMENRVNHPLLSNLCVYVAQDCTIYIGDVLELCTGLDSSPSSNSSKTESKERTEDSDCASSSVSTSSRSETWKSVIILIPVRLGGVDFNNLYAPCVKTVLANSMCLGVIGGKPKHSLYFVGWQEEKIIYLDPHFCQDFVDCDMKGFSLDTFHCNQPRKMSISKMDPSCTIGFYCKTKEDFFTFINEAQKIVAPPLDRMPCPMFVFQDGKSEESISQDNAQPKADRILKVCHYDREGRQKPPKTSDDFVFL